jgi:hypothetical protein
MSIKAKGTNIKMVVNRALFIFLCTFVAIIPENIKREVLQEISRFLESNLP